MSKIKLDMTMVPRSLKRAAARSMTKNIKKYPNPTWKDIPWEKHLAAAERHLDSLIEGKFYDEDGDSNLDNLTARIAFLTHLYENDNG